MCDFNYGITIKCIQKGVFASENDLFTVMMECIDRHKGIMCEFYFETDSMNRKHIHGHFMARRGIRYNLYKKQFYTIHIDPLRHIHDVQQWLQYIKKEGYNMFINDLKSGSYLFQEQDQGVVNSDAGTNALDDFANRTQEDL